MKSILVSIIFVFWSITSFAVIMDSFTSAGVVKSFDQKTVTVLCQERIIQIPRNSIQEKKFQTGGIVKFKLTGEQVSKIFFSDKKPASLPGK